MLSHHGDKEVGMLSYMELTDLDFIPRRMYYISNVPKGEIRGKHGHYEDQQYLFCLQGQIKIDFVSKEGENTQVLNPGDVAFLDRMVWSQQQYMTGNELMLVLCSRKYDQGDYFYSRKEVNT
jgi:dTDP-4-dehydrorhamnose 3,5-epimerase-like enzyme